MERERIINTARGIEKADLVIKNANIVNVLTEEIYNADIAILMVSLSELAKITKDIQLSMLRANLFLHHLLMDTFILKALCLCLPSLPNSLYHLEQLL